MTLRSFAAKVRSKCKLKRRTSISSALQYQNKMSYKRRETDLFSFSEVWCFCALWTKQIVIGPNYVYSCLNSSIFYLVWVHCVLFYVILPTIFEEWDDITQPVHSGIHLNCLLILNDRFICAKTADLFGLVLNNKTYSPEY